LRITTPICCKVHYILKFSSPAETGHETFFCLLLKN
jgi:hypothetical protein